MTTKLFENVKWEMEVYGTEAFATCKVDVMRTNPVLGGAIRWTFVLMFGTKETSVVNYDGDRASGFAECAIVDGTAKMNQDVMIEIGETIETPFGSYVVEWYSKTNHDHLKLVEVKK